MCITAAITLYIARVLVRGLAVAILFSVSPGGLAADQPRFQCGGEVEVLSWQLWDTSGRRFVRERLLQDRLLQQRDVYALYDFQHYMHNLVSMARRCQRTYRMIELAELVRIAFGALEPDVPMSAARQWICRGGTTCLSNPGLLNTEVMLCSVQFLALATAIANALSLSDAFRDPRVTSYRQQAVDVASAHLLRWADNGEIDRLRSLKELRPETIRPGSSSAFFSDKLLWEIAIYAELSGIFLVQQRYADASERPLDTAKTIRMQRHLAALMELFLARVTYRGKAADIDRGFWRLFPNYRYAGYERPEKPVTCSSPTSDRPGEVERVSVAPDTVPQRTDTGWDFSHARRLVHALDAIERNRTAMSSIFGLAKRQMPKRDIAASFANALLTTIWNKDAGSPLFTNYWSGANGWIGTFVDLRSQACSEGTPPYGLTESFPNGGYASWSVYLPQLGSIGATLFDLVTMPPDLTRIIRPSATSGETRWSAAFVLCFHNVCVLETSPLPPARTA